MTGAALLAHGELLAPYIEVVRPDGPGPFPVMIQLHGCGGVQPLQRTYAEVARVNGAAAVIVDSHTPRQISRLAAHALVCTGLRLRAFERALDLAAALDWVMRQSWADGARIGAAGWSHGGWTIMDALADRREALSILGRVRAAALFYPYAGPLARTASQGWGERRPKVFACLAGRDRVVGRRAPRRALARLEADGLEVEVLDLSEATHAFDDDAASDPRTVFRQDLASEARSLYLKALCAL